MRRLVTYGFVGGVGSLIYLVITLILSELSGPHPVAASAVGYGGSFLFSFLMNHYFVFRSSKNPRSTLVKFSAVSAFGLFFTSLIMAITTELLGVHYMYGVATVLVAIPTSNYLLNLHWTFKQ
uniref:Flippase GtrA (Transmembrane translocase of bactoprenol-linked glucose) n=1 Tax=Candidatus Kentrum sp. SD TaxID=2126332 RepID=A0A451BMQ9_9GAMM|nr:MAG: Putative flippase GtrA (transmembrane translocase of bactoprenol-linked glucose) [Candidatus Kentron sp. SD]